MKEFEAHRWLGNPHLMTLAGALLPRRIPNARGVEDRFFEVEPGTQLMARCQWQQEPRRSPTLAVVHGLEGSSESPYMRGLANRAFADGFNVLRINQRNCGGTERLTATLYNSGLSADFEAVLMELIQRDRLPRIFFAGFSMGGNLVLKMAGELGAARPHELCGVLAVSPSLDLAACVKAISQRENWLYQWHFVRHLKSRLRRKAKLFPGQFELNGMGRVRTVREFDEAVTAPHCGYRNASDYYERASALRCTERIAVPTLIITAQDDPVVPFASFRALELARNPWIQVVAPERGGHCSFISRFAGPERFWAEAQVLEFCKAQGHDKPWP